MDRLTRTGDTGDTLDFVVHAGGTSNSDWTYIPLDFLTPGVNYTAYIYRDTDPSATTVQQVTDKQMTVTSNTVITADMASNGGHAILLIPQ